MINVVVSIGVVGEFMCLRGAKSQRPSGIVRNCKPTLSISAPPLADRPGQDISSTADRFLTAVYRSCCNFATASHEEGAAAPPVHPGM